MFSGVWNIGAGSVLGPNRTVWYHIFKNNIIQFGPQTGLQRRTLYIFFNILDRYWIFIIHSMNRSICLQANNIDIPFKLHSEGTLSGVCFKMTSLMKNQSLFSIFKCNIFLVKIVTCQCFQAEMSIIYMYVNTTRALHGFLDFPKVICF